MTETFYRFHWADCPELSAANAYSALWGAERNADGSKTVCSNCGNGAYGLDPDECGTCDGEGWEDCAEGYSACESPEELIAYFAERGAPCDTEGQVIVFEGRRVGSGFDGEALAIPTTVIKTMPWSQFTAKAAV